MQRCCCTIKTFKYFLKIEIYINICTYIDSFTDHSPAQISEQQINRPKFKDELKENINFAKISLYMQFT